MSLSDLLIDIDEKFEAIEKYIITFLSENLLENGLSQADIDSIFKRKISNYKFYAKSNLKITKEQPIKINFIRYTDDYEISENYYDGYKFIKLTSNNSVVAALTKKEKMFCKLTEDQSDFLSSNNIDNIITDMYI